MRFPFKDRSHYIALRRSGTVHEVAENANETEDEDETQSQDSADNKNRKAKRSYNRTALFILYLFVASLLCAFLGCMYVWRTDVSSYLRGLHLRTGSQTGAGAARAVGSREGSLPGGVPVRRSSPSNLVDMLLRAQIWGQQGKAGTGGKQGAQGAPAPLPVQGMRTDDGVEGEEGETKAGKKGHSDKWHPVGAVGSKEGSLPGGGGGGGGGVVSPLSPVGAVRSGPPSHIKEMLLHAQIRGHSPASPWGGMRTDDGEEGFGGETQARKGSRGRGAG
jgi:hypothetical protein